MAKLITVEQATDEGWYKPNTNEGYCHCGCGQFTNIPLKTSKTRGLLKGQPVRFIKHHHSGIDISGQRFGRLIVLEKVKNEKEKAHELKWRCLCDCGNEKIVIGCKLRNGTTKSCGCLWRENLNFWSKERRERTHCVRGHEYTDENIYIQSNGARSCKRCERDVIQPRRTWKKREKDAKELDEKIEEILFNHPDLKEITDGLQV